jgi:cobalamin biosynthesis protein CobD/CbiB
MSGGKSGSVNQARSNVKLFWGILLLILTPVFLFVEPISKTAILRDLLLVIWWAFVLWLLITGTKESKPTNSK